MSVRPPSIFAPKPEQGLDLLGHEIMAEKASALGRAGERAVRALSALREASADDPQRNALLRDTADAVYAYFIQRELCGMRRHHEIIREFAIPNEVLARLGAK